MNYTIYQITCKTTGKIYIGKHQTKDLNDGYMGSGKLLKRAQRKYGLENFSKEILYVFETEEEMNNKEAELVSEEFCLKEDTYNICPGGKGGWGYVNQNDISVRNFTKLNAKNIGSLGGIKTKLLHGNNPEFIRKRNLNLNPLAFKGKTHSEETKKLMSEKIKQGQKKVQCPHCNKIGEKGNMNRWHFDNCRNKV